MSGDFLYRVTKRVLVIGLMVVMFSAVSVAAERVDLLSVKSASISAINAQKQTDGSRTVRGLEAQNEIRALGLTDQNSFTVIGKFIDRSGKTHFRQRQLFNGIPIWGEHVNMRVTKNGWVDNLHGRIVTDIEFDLDSITPSFDGKTLIEALKGQKTRQSAKNTNFLFENERVELVIFLDNEDMARLAYEVSFFVDDGKGNPSRPFYLVDAHSKNVLKHWEGLAHSKVGTGPGGNEKAGQYEYGTDYDYLDVTVVDNQYILPNNNLNALPISNLSLLQQCIMDNSNVKTVDLNHGFWGSTAYSYSCYRNTHEFINGAYSPLNDAHYFGGIVHDMYYDWLGVPPLTFQIMLRVHYGTNYENAFWNGSSVTFGDGNEDFYPPVSLDILAHEVSHGFTEQHANLIYSGMSGGINDAFSDMAGEAAEQYMNGSANFMVGANIKKGSGALRYMYDPPLDGKSIDHADDYVSGMSVHHSSGVYNKAFYLLSVSSDWDPAKAFKTFAGADQLYWGPSETFDSAACGVMAAGKDLGYNTQKIIDAFAAVGVACPFL